MLMPEIFEAVRQHMHSLSVWWVMSGLHIFVVKVKEFNFENWLGLHIFCCKSERI